MKIQIFAALASVIAASCLLGEDLKVVLMAPPKDGPSPITVDPKDPSHFMGLLTEKGLQMLTSDDPSITPKMRLVETRVIHGVHEGKVYKVVPDSIGLKGFPNLEFSFRRLKDGFMKVDLVLVAGEVREKTSLTMESHVLVKLSNATTERSIYCALGVETGKNDPGQQGGADQATTAVESKAEGKEKSKTESAARSQ